MTTSDSRESPFWNFSCRIYDDPEVQQECLALQDSCGVNVNLLLFCAFAGAILAKMLSDNSVKELASLVDAWDNEVVIHLRGVRRALKVFDGLTSPTVPAVTALRSGVKALELEAERIEQAIIELWSIRALENVPPAESAEATLANIQTLLAIYNVDRSSPLPRRVIGAALALAEPDCI